MLEVLRGRITIQSPRFLLARSGGRGSGRFGRFPARVVVAWAILITIFLYATLVPWAASLDPYLVDFARAGLAPGAQNILGTDSAGHDLFIRVAAGLRVSLFIALAVAIFSACLGTFMGVVAGMTGGWVDRLIMRVVDGLNSLPHFVLSVVIVSLYRGSVIAIVASLVLTHWLSIARIVRAAVLCLRRAEYVEAAWLVGMSRWQIIRHHFVPAALGQSMVGVVLLVPHAVWHESTLSFLGLGLPPHEASLGTLLSDAEGALLLGHWWVLVFPSIFLIVTTLSVSVIGWHLKDRLTGTDEVLR